MNTVHDVMQATSKERKPSPWKKGILLAAGRGTRLYPMTLPVAKPLLPVYDKPMLYYPLSVLMQAGIQEVLIIVPPGELEIFSRLLGDGTSLGMSIQYKEQPVQRGIADAFMVGEDFIGQDPVCLILGDNIFYGESLRPCLAQAQATTDSAIVFGCWVEDPRPFGVVEFNEEGKAVSIEEKPAHPRSHYIVPGLYFYDNQVVDIAKNVQPSQRGELEITSVNNAYLQRHQLHVIPLGQDFVWLDAGTENSLLESAHTIRAIQEKSGRYVACLEEIALVNGWITPEQAEKAARRIEKTKYGQYLLSVLSQWK